MQKQVKSSNQATLNKVVVDDIFKDLSASWNLKVPRLSDDDLVLQLGGKKDRTKLILSNIITKRIKHIRTLASIGAKIKSGQTLKSDEEIVSDFLSTQTEPVLGDRYVDLLSATVEEVFKDFPYSEVVDDINKSTRRRYLTTGSSYPLSPVPLNDNIEVLENLYGIHFGKQVFNPEFAQNIDLRTFNKGLADGKISLVPKNWKTKRMITIASNKLIDEQYVIHLALRNFITSRSRNTSHIIQFDDQTVQHKFLIDNYCTIDLSSASDRVYRKLIERVWPQFMGHFEKYLPKTVVGLDGKTIHDLTCIGTQGFPLTFTVMSIIVGLIVESVKNYTPYYAKNLLSGAYPSANYGDDIVIHANDFNEVFVALESLGLKVNTSKTHKATNGFLESCGVDMFFSPDGRRYDVTPIHLRGYSHVEIVQFFTQLTYAEMIAPHEAIRIMKKNKVKFFAFDHPHQTTGFHYNYKPEHREENFYTESQLHSKVAWNKSLFRHERRLPVLSMVPDRFRGLNAKDSKDLFDLLYISDQHKSFNANRTSIIKHESVAKKHIIMDMKEKFKNLHIIYTHLKDGKVDNIALYEECNVNYETICAFRLVETNLREYNLRPQVIDFDFNKVKVETYSSLLDTLLGIKQEIVYPVYRYKKQMRFISIEVPNPHIAD